MKLTKDEKFVLKAILERVAGCLEYNSAEDDFEDNYNNFILTLSHSDANIFSNILQKFGKKEDDYFWQTEIIDD